MEHVSFDRNIVQYYGVCMEGENAAMLVLEYMAVRQKQPSPLNLLHDALRTLAVTHNITAIIPCCPVRVYGQETVGPVIYDSDFRATSGCICCLMSERLFILQPHPIPAQPESHQFRALTPLSIASGAVQGGDLRQALTTRDEGAFAWTGPGKSVALDISRGLHFLHTSGVVHRSRSPTDASSALCACPVSYLAVLLRVLTGPLLLSLISMRAPAAP